MIRFSDQNGFVIEQAEMLEKWISEVANSHKKVLGDVDYVFCSDDFLLRINQEYLSHDTFTDIITFDYSMADELAGEIYISTDRVAENASDFGVPRKEELHRVIIHGILHLCGYSDSTEDEKRAMRRLEEKALELRDDALRKEKE